MKIKITVGHGWYEELVGQEFDVYYTSDYGTFDKPELVYHVDPPAVNEWTRFVSEFDCEVILD